MKLDPLSTLIKNLLLIVLIVFQLKFPGNGKANESLLKDVVYLILTVIVLNIMLDKPQNFFRNVQVEEISYHAIKNEENVLYVDARSENSYRDYHITNAINIPYEHGSNAYSRKFLERLKKADLSSHKYIVTYCDTKICNLALGLAYRIKEEYPNLNVFYLKEGLGEWQKQSL